MNDEATPVTILDGPEAVTAALGSNLGRSEWLSIDQPRIDMFAAATGDHQWIHVDRERAAAGPFGTTIAHGYLTLALTNYFLPRIVEVRGFDAGINYGLDKVRFPTPVPVGSRVRAEVELVGVTEIAGGLQTEMKISVEVEGVDKPACVAIALSRWLTS